MKGHPHCDPEFREVGAKRSSLQHYGGGGHSAPILAALRDLTVVLLMDLDDNREQHLMFERTVAQWSGLRRLVASRGDERIGCRRQSATHGHKPRTDPSTYRCTRSSCRSAVELRWEKI